MISKQNDMKIFLNGGQKKDAVLPQIRLKYFGPDENGEKPKDPSATCSECGKKNISLGGMIGGTAEEPGFLCEECAIDRHREEFGFASREAAAAHRRRMFDVSYLFQEMAIDRHLREHDRSIDDLTALERDIICRIAEIRFNEKLSVGMKNELEEMESQETIERILGKEVKKLNIPWLGQERLDAVPESEAVDIRLSRRQLNELLLVMDIGMWVREAMLEAEDKSFDFQHQLQARMYAEADRVGLGKSVERFFGNLGPAAKTSRKVERIMEEYNEDTFWDRLEVDLGKRDFFRSLSDEEREEIENDPQQQLPEKIEWFYEKYGKELEEYGIDRLEIVE